MDRGGITGDEASLASHKPRPGDVLGCACPQCAGQRAEAPDGVGDGSRAAYKPVFDVDAAVAALTRWGVQWDDGIGASGPGTPGRATYGFLTQGGVDALSGLDPADDHVGLNAVQIALVEMAVALIEDVANIDLVRVPGAIGSEGSADIAIFGQTGTNGGWMDGTMSRGRLTSAQVNLGTSGLDRAGTYAFSTVVHELLHALGLAHPSEYDGEEATSYDADADYREDSRQYSVMSYWSEHQTGADFGYSEVLAPQLHDVAALQYLYGANMTTRTGDTTYGYGGNAGPMWTLGDQGPAMIGAIWDAGGIDTLDLSGWDRGQVIDLRQGAFSSVTGQTDNLSIAYGVVIENAIGGSGDDRLIGNEADNVLDGGLGFDWIDLTQASHGVRLHLGVLGPQDTGDGWDDIRSVEAIDGSAFSDWLGSGAPGHRVDAGAGDDTVEASSGGDFLDGGAGFDVLSFESSAVGLVVNDYLQQRHIIRRADNFEAFQATHHADTILGGDDDEVYFVGDGDDRVDGGAGADIIEGGKGADNLSGGAGDDVIFGDGGALDELPPALIGTDGADLLIGNAMPNYIVGGAGDDTLRGVGSNDTLEAGVGDDLVRPAWGFAVADGGSGRDTLDLGAYDDGVIVHVTGAFSLRPGEWLDEIIGRDFEVLVGSAAADEFRVQNRSGGDPDTVVLAGDGDDIFYFEYARLDAFGGDGDDRYVMIGTDVDLTIADFVIGEDVLDFQSITHTRSDGSSGGIGLGDLVIEQMEDGMQVRYDEVVYGSPISITLLGIAAGDLTPDSFAFDVS